MNKPATAKEALRDSYRPDARSNYDVPGASTGRAVRPSPDSSTPCRWKCKQQAAWHWLDAFFNIAPLNRRNAPKPPGWSYTTGRYTDTEQAQVRKEGGHPGRGKDAFVTAYLNGKRIPMKEAAALLERFLVRRSRQALMERSQFTAKVRTSRFGGVGRTHVSHVPKRTFRTGRTSAGRSPPRMRSGPRPRVAQRTMWNTFWHVFGRFVEVCDK
ncbi:MAG: hypothetical protein IPO56_17135 [Flavobacteriales bacterium]|nr:hypothetical protein [Flavobacteriales bacterium]